MAKANVASKEDVLEAISQMSVMDLVELISEMEEKFGVTAAAPVAVAAAPAAGDSAEASGEKSNQNLKLFLQERVIIRLLLLKQLELSLD